MKRAYVRPTMVGERFVAACGDKGTVYKFNCDAPGGPLYYYPNSDGMVDGVHNENDKVKLLGLFIIHVMQNMRQVLQMFSMMDL